MTEPILGRGGPSDRMAIPLATRLGTWIPNERPSEMPPWILKEYVDMRRTELPDAWLRSVSATYNCYGLVFASRRTWVDLESIRLIFNEDGYRRVDAVGEVLPGDLVVYRNRSEEICHIGVVVEKSPRLQTALWDILVLSKWGKEGEYLHPVDYVPELYGVPSEYWSERRLLT